MPRITNREMRNAFEALRAAYAAAGLTETLYGNRGDGPHTATAADLILSEGSATYGNSWGVWLSPWHNGARWDGASAHYTPRGLGALSTDRAEALARMRSYTGALWAVVRAERDGTRVAPYELAAEVTA